MFGSAWTRKFPTTCDDCQARDVTPVPKLVKNEATSTDAQAEFDCPKCGAKYAVALVAVEG